MGKYDLTQEDIQANADAFLVKVYASVKPSDRPTLEYITAGPGAGKTGIEWYLKDRLARKGRTAQQFGSDLIAEYHPNYQEILDNEKPEEVYRLTRQFVRPATPIIIDALIKRRINLVNENTLDKGESDIEQARRFKEAGYRIRCNIMATDLFESRLSCYERDARSLENGITPRGCSLETQLRMYDGFIPGVKRLLEEGLLDDVKVFTRGERMREPNVVYQYANEVRQPYVDFEEAVRAERRKQRIILMENPAAYYDRIRAARKTIAELGINPTLTQDTLDGLQRLQDDFDEERLKYIASKREGRQGYSLDD